MVIPRLRWSLLAATALLFTPAPPISIEGLSRIGLIPDSTFEIPDSVRAYLSQVSRLVIASDSSLYLTDWQLPAILHLEPSGKFRRVIGRQGQGPGEFSQIFTIGTVRDSLWAMDIRQVRVTLFPPRGDGVETVPFGPNAARPGRPGTYSTQGAPTSLLADGNILLEEGPPDPRKPTHGLLLRVDREMRVLDTIAQLAGEHSAMPFQWADGQALIPQPFTDAPLYAASADGSMLVLVNRLAATRTGDAEIVVVGLRNGKEQLFSRTISYRPQPLPQRAADSVIAFLAKGPGDGSPWPLTTDSVRRKLFKPPFLPPVTKLRVARDGTIWLKVQLADSPTDADDYMQLSPRGLPLRRVNTPKGFELLEADRKTVWGTVPDSLDLPQVQRYSLNQGITN